MLKNFLIIIFLSLTVTLFCEEKASKKMSLPTDVQKLIDEGEFAKAQSALKALMGEKISEEQKEFYYVQNEILDRIRIDFSKNGVVIFEELKKEIPDVSKDEMEKWRREGKLEGKNIDGVMMYFKRAVGNLFILSKEARTRRDAFKNTESEKQKAAQALRDPRDAAKEFDYNAYMRKVIDAGKASSEPYVLPVKYHLDYTLTLKPDVVPAGETVRCWLPFPRNNEFNRDIKLISTEPQVKVVAPEEALQRTLYYERKILPEDKGTSVTFKASYEFTAYAFSKMIDPAKVKDYDKNSEVYKKYTMERPPHLVFTEELKSKVRQIVGDEQNPYLKAKKIYKWINDNVPWTGAIEYSTIPNISEYCFQNKRGDCGIQSLLFVVMCRIEGIPARWQSGWSLVPDKEGMHDWAMFYIEPYGWLPIDQSRGLRDTKDEEVRWFFFGNTDAFRLAANDDYSMPLVPPKKFFRSEPVDFQRGEVEWSGGNLYFDKWTYDFDIKRLTPLP